MLLINIVVLFSSPLGDVSLLSACQWPLSRYKGTTFFADFQIFRHLCVDTIGLYVDMFCQFVGKICLFFVPRGTLPEKIFCWSVYDITDFFPIFAPETQKDILWIEWKLFRSGLQRKRSRALTFFRPTTHITPAQRLFGLLSHSC